MSLRCVERDFSPNTNGTGDTYDGEDERVGEVSVERKLHHVPPQPQ